MMAAKTPTGVTPWVILRNQLHAVQAHTQVRDPFWF